MCTFLLSCHLWPSTSGGEEQGKLSIFANLCHPDTWKVLTLFCEHEHYMGENSEGNKSSTISWSNCLEMYTEDLNWDLFSCPSWHLEEEVGVRIDFTWRIWHFTEEEWGWEIDSPPFKCLVMWLWPEYLKSNNKVMCDLQNGFRKYSAWFKINIQWLLEKKPRACFKEHNPRGTKSDMKIILGSHRVRKDYAPIKNTI